MRDLMLGRPDGADIDDPSDDQIRQAVDDATDRDDMGLHLYEPDRWALLVITSHEGLGWSVVLEHDEGLPQVLSAAPEDRAEVAIWYLQNRIRVPRSHFVPKDVASEAALAFARKDKGALQIAGAEWIEWQPSEPIYDT